MPSAADDLISGFDDVASNQPGVADEDAWPTKASKKSKKKKAKKIVEEDVIQQDEEVGLPFAAAVEPANEPGVSVGGGREELGGMEEANGGVLDNGTPPEAEALAFIEQQPALEPERAVSRQPPPPPSYPAVPNTNLSARPAQARPISTSHTPPSRPVSLHSPPAQYARLATYRPANNTTTQPRRESYTAARTSPGQRFVEPAAPPHMPQPHFYALPDLGFGFNQKKEAPGKLPGADGYCCCFDSFADAGDAASARKARTALLVGSEGALDVYRVLPNKVEVVGRLEGLRGSVIDAKVLPHLELGDMHHNLRPMVAVVLHGVLVESSDDGWVGDGGSVAIGGPIRYQTSVEVYSLQTHEHIATLFRTLPVVLEQPTIGHMSTIPQPLGDLRVGAQGKFVTVSSGKSGEVFVFTHAATMATSDEAPFRCVGKLWTSLQSPLDRPTSRAAGSPENGSTSDEIDHKPGVPLLSLSKRWLAIVPPAMPTQISIQGVPLLTSSSPGAPGLSSHSAPPQPSITCDIAGLDSEGAWGRLTRQAAQGVVKYSQRGLEMGWQGWNELVHPTTQSGQQHARAPSKDESFPPTNAPPADSRKEANDPAVVSIIDLEALLEAEEMRLKYPPSPIATFALADGCNHVSLSATGLQLLTVSRKGEISSVWDLKQAVHGVASHSISDDEEASLGPCLKQLLRIQRSSQCVVTETVWSRDDEYIAVLTNHGTVHLHEVPSRPFTCKRKRRATSTTAQVENSPVLPTASPSVSPQPTSNNNFLGTLRSGFQQVGTQVTSLRSNAAAVPTFAIPTLANIRDTATSAGQASSRAFVRGLSQGYSAARSGATDYLHADDNKIRNKALQDIATSGMLRWVKRQSGTLLAIVAGGTVYLHSVSRVERRRGAELISGLKHDRGGRKHFDLPAIRTAADDGEGVMERVKRADECAAAGPHGFWSLQLASSGAHRDGEGSNGRAPVPVQASEVETNPAYCPFHVDSNTGVYALGEGGMSTGSQIRLLPPQERRREEDIRNSFLTQGQVESQPQLRSSEEQNWVFGDSLPSSTKMNLHDELLLDDFQHDFGNAPEEAVEDDYGDDDLADDDQEGLAEQVESRLTVVSDSGNGEEEIRVHTRKAKGRG